MKFEIVSLIKNEEDIIENFIDYHKNIVDEITLIDNGSSDSTVDRVKKHKNVKLHIKVIPFKFKSNIVNHFIKKSKCDIVIPMDADELMVLDNSKNPQVEKNQITADHSKIRQYLQSLPLCSKYHIKKIYNLLPHTDSFFDVEKNIPRSNKIFVSKNDLININPGFHFAKTSKICQMKTNLSYLHFHYRNFNAWYKSSKQKMMARLGGDWNDLDKLQNYSGLSHHVAQELHGYFTTGKWHDLKPIVQIKF